MVRLALIAPVLALLGGCIIYDTKCKDCGWDDPGRPSRDPGDTAADTGDKDTGGDVAVEAVFTLNPSEAAQGASIIGSLTADGEFDYGTIDSVEVFGDVTLAATTIRDDEVLLSLSVAADGAGTADVLVHLVDGSVAFVADALTIVPAGGSGDGTGDGSGDGSGTGDGSGSGDDGCP